MQRLSARQIGELASELNQLVAGLELCEVQPLPPRDLLLIFAVESAGRDPESNRPLAVRRLRISVDPDAPRVHLQHDRVHRYDGPIGPFYRKLSDELCGLQLKRIEQVALDRILRFIFVGERRFALIVELGGRNGNQVLLDGSGQIVDLLIPASEKATNNKTARLVVGSEWVRPPGSPPSDPGQKLAEAWPEPSESFPVLRVAAPLSRRVEAVLGIATLERDRDREKRSLVQRLKRKQASAKGLLAGLDKRKRAADGAERVRMDGDLLKSNLHAVERGADSIELCDWFEDGALRRIALDPKLPPQENLKRIFKRYHKLQRSGEELEREQALAETRLTLVNDLISRLEATDWKDIEREAVSGGVLTERRMKTHRDKQATTKRLPYRSFTACHGSEIRVGRSARDNDVMNSKHARGNDMWLHTRDAPGSHVILRMDRGKEPDSEEVLDAAHLALHFSPLKNAASGAVHVASRKQVHKPKGAPPGLVTLSGGRTLDLRVEPERLQRLLRGAEHTS